MALIKCPECGKEVSDTIKKCSSCGYRIKKRNNKKIIILIAIILVLISISVIIGLLVHKTNEKKKVELYKSNISEITTMINKNSSLVKSCGTLIHNVWNNAIQEKFDDTTDKYTVKNPSPGEGSSFEEVWNWIDEEHFYDYNTALQNLFSAEEFTGEINKIGTEQKKIEEKIKELKNPPTQLEEEYETVKDYYETYLSFTTMVTDVSGSLQTWSNNYNDTESDLLNCYKKVQTYVDNKK